MAIHAAEEGQGEEDAIFTKSANGEGVVINAVDNDRGATYPMIEPENSTVLPVLETVAERRARRRSHYVVYFSTFIGSVGFSIVLTGVWPYVKQIDPDVSKEFLGWIIAANPLGQMLMSPVLGYWGNKAGSIRGPLLLSVNIFILGNILYAILSVFGTYGKALMVFARLLVGVSFANMAVIRSYVASATTTAERTSAVAMTSASQGFGFIIGPALQAAIAVAVGKGSNDVIVNGTVVESMNETEANILILDEESNTLQWDLYTAAGWVAAFLGFINMFLFLPCIFKEHHIAAKEAQLLKAAKEDNMKLPKPDYPTVVTLLIAFFIVQFAFVLLEVLLVPMSMDMYAWDDEMTVKIIGISLCVAGLVATVMFGLVGRLAKIFDERKVFIILGIIPLTIAMICFFPMGNTYPKIQNCTIEVSPSNHRNTRSVNEMPYYLQDLALNHMENEDSIEKYSDKYMFTNSNLSLSELFANITTVEYNTLYQKTLSRQKRRIRRDGKCHDTGCPPEQEWCNYVPIIEKSQMIVACFIAFIGYPVAFSLSSSLYSKLLGPKPQGVWMGILTSIGSFARMTGPVFVSYMYTALGLRWTFGFLFVVMASVLVMTLIIFKRLIPMKVTS